MLEPDIPESRGKKDLTIYSTSTRLAECGSPPTSPGFVQESLGIVLAFRVEPDRIGGGISEDLYPHVAKWKRSETEGGTAADAHGGSAN